jgi:hypothetical protein
VVVPGAIAVLRDRARQPLRAVRTVASRGQPAMEPGPGRSSTSFCHCVGGQVEATTVHSFPQRVASCRVASLKSGNGKSGYNVARPWRWPLGRCGTSRTGTVARVTTSRSRETSVGRGRSSLLWLVAPRRPRTPTRDVTPSCGMSAAFGWVRHVQDAYCGIVSVIA